MAFLSALLMVIRSGMDIWGSGSFGLTLRTGQVCGVRLVDGGVGNTSSPFHENHYSESVMQALSQFGANNLLLPSH
ncbi:hypothetical protein GNF10_36240 [Nostoc sp. UCD121]|uniref:hypothetical protein n=1 Tax=unclassified Nostoc TaxID=2593658 RepID=UPI001623AD82|nr:MULTISPECIES: hypothetical protein [unclassified Nostoc]MBC1221524.1 hypothetical protein [Nostoc sp. UCD120]MBC1281227.1 hypothetical protein [Nostoc sp. UCD121]MBC1299939.1 hypothetical protein [Nostoc sp. UCD122]